MVLAKRTGDEVQALEGFWLCPISSEVEKEKEREVEPEETVQCLLRVDPSTSMGLTPR